MIYELHDIVITLNFQNVLIKFQLNKIRETNLLKSPQNAAKFKFNLSKIGQYRKPIFLMKFIKYSANYKIHKNSDYHNLYNF